MHLFNLILILGEVTILWDHTSILVLLCSSSGTSIDIRISWLLPSMMKWVHTFMILLLFLSKDLLSLLVEVIRLIEVELLLILFSYIIIVIGIRIFSIILTRFTPVVIFSPRVFWIIWLTRVLLFSIVWFLMLLIVLNVSWGVLTHTTSWSYSICVVVVRLHHEVLMFDIF